MANFFNMAAKDTSSSQPLNSSNRQDDEQAPPNQPVEANSEADLDTEEEMWKDRYMALLERSKAILIKYLIGDIDG